VLEERNPVVEIGKHRAFVLSVGSKKEPTDHARKITGGVKALTREIQGGAW